jgi:NADH dehydrogenase (ubiquinone) Fe-S protein 6
MISRRAIPQLARTLRRAASTTPSVKKESPVPTQPNEDLPTVKQAPNYPTTWSTNQQPRPGLGSSPRFEQTNMELQPNPLSAMELIANEPVRVVHGRKAVCDGGPFSFPHFYSFLSLTVVFLRADLEPLLLCPCRGLDFCTSTNELTKI